MKTSRKQRYGKLEEVFISSKKVKLKRQLVENNRTRNLDLKNLTLVQKVKKKTKKLSCETSGNTVMNDSNLA